MQIQMDFIKFKNLFFEASKFRKAIDECDKSLLPSPFNNIPSGCCKEASFILANYLKEKGFGNFDYISGIRMNRTHGWLLQDEIIIDITADQFEDNNENVIVSVNSKWHKEFNGVNQNIADLNTYDEKSRSILLSAYNEILKKIKTQ
jgi:hypothetical protein